MSNWTPDDKPVVTRADIVAGLRAIGLQSGDLVQVHSSLSAFGYVEGGADTVVDALLEVLGPEGTLMVPTFNHGREKIFDPETSPSVSGRITEVVRLRPEAHRSIHPTHPYAAIGPLAEWLTAGHLETGTFALDSPLGKLIRRGGKILLLGVGMNANTAAHVAEAAYGAPCLGIREYPRKVRLDGRVIEAWGVRFRSGPCKVEWDPIERTMRSRGMIRDGRIGMADLMLMLGRDMYDVTYELCERLCPTCDTRPQELPSGLRRGE
ncbi:MAG: AAC(3) family N-acetyltransferase [Armatimonadetes bacterium]|nr:AAC(3) family N-acetyltransferase [Armatimonadota bacterium]